MPVTRAAGRPHLALLRGINVGGKNIIEMTALRACFEAAGCTQVATYIQSGNVVFHAPGRRRPLAALRATLEAALATRFGYAARLVLLDRAQVARVVAEAPAGFGGEPARYRYDVLFVRAPMTAARALEELRPREGVDTVAAGTLALYARRLIARAAQSHLTKLVQLPVYQDLTIRNWNTTTALARMMALA